MNIPRGAPLPAKLRVRLAQVVLVEGERHVARFSECSRQALARALAGLPIYRGMAALLERYLEKNKELLKKKERK